MMWLLTMLLLALVALAVIKLVQLSQFWVPYGLPYEPYPRYLYRIFWLLPNRVTVKLIRDDVKRFGKIYGSYRGVKPSLVVSDLDFAKEVLIKQFHNFFGRTMEAKTGDALFDNALLRLPYDEWKALRTVMGYTFTTAKMRGMIIKLDKVSKRFVDKAVELSSGHHEVLLKPLLKGYGMDSMCAIAFGLDVNCLNDPDSDFIRHSSEVIRPGFTMMLFFIAPYIMRYVPFINFPPRGTSEFFGRVGRVVLAEKRQRLDEVIAAGTADIIDHHLIAQRNQPDAPHLTDDILAAQSLLFLIAGVDSTVLTLELATYFLAVHPEAEQRAYDEVRSVLGDRTEVSYEDLHRMKFVESCLLEALRLAPLPQLVDRICTEDTEVAGIKINKGMIVEFPVPAIHMDEDNFPEPEKFKPERFVKKSDFADDQEHFAFLFFGAGPKNCVGRRLALMNLQTALVNILLRMRIERGPNTPDYPFKMRPGMRFLDISQRPLVVKLTPRSSAAPASD